MEISKLVILGLGGEMQNLFSDAGLKVSTPDLTGDYAQELSDADMILENLPGDTELKKDVFCKYAKTAPQKAIFATTSESGITEIATGTGRAQNFIGLNFTLNPTSQKYLVQITKGLETSEETVRACRELIEKVGATVVELQDSAGLILNRILASIINEASLMYATEVASTEHIDGLMKSCTNWPMGPFEFADTIGIDKVVTTLELLSQQLGPQYLPHPLLRKMVAAGRLGKKTGKGFYTYS
jgi:3-hydroxyacyl-CoA dehydrogenase